MLFLKSNCDIRDFHIYIYILQPFVKLINKIMVMRRLEFNEQQCILSLSTSVIHIRI